MAVCCSSASVSSAVALLQLLEQAGVLDGDDGLVRERLKQRDLSVGERDGPPPSEVDHPDRLRPHESAARRRTVR